MLIEWFILEVITEEGIVDIGSGARGKYDRDSGDIDDTGHARANTPVPKRNAEVISSSLVGGIKCRYIGLCYLLGVAGENLLQSEKECE